MDTTEKITNLYKYHKRTTDTDSNLNFHEEAPVYYPDPSNTSDSATINSSGKIIFKDEIYSGEISQLNPFITDDSDYISLFQIYNGSTWIDYVRPYEHLHSSPLQNSSQYSNGTAIATVKTIGSKWTSGTPATNQWRFNESDILTALDITDISKSTIDFAEYEDAFEKKYLGGALLSTSNTNIVKVLNLKLYYIEETASSTSSSSGNQRSIRFYHPILKKCIPANFGKFLSDDRTTTGTGKKTYTFTDINSWTRTGTSTDKSNPENYKGQSGFLLSWDGENKWSSGSLETDIKSWSTNEDGDWNVHEDSGILAFYDSISSVDFVNRYYTPWITFFRYQGEIGVFDDSGLIPKDLTVKGNFSIRSSSSSGINSVYKTDRIIFNVHDFKKSSGSSVVGSVSETVTAHINIPYNYKVTGYKIYCSSSVNITISKTYLSGTADSVLLTGSSTESSISGTWTDWSSDPFYLKIQLSPVSSCTINGGYLEIQSI